MAKHTTAAGTRPTSAHSAASASSRWLLRPVSPFPPGRTPALPPLPAPHFPLPLVFATLLLVRLSAALYAHIADCDETFNYWEAVHLVLFGGKDEVGRRTRSFETWEYDPEYAIRSWAYVLIHAAVGWVARVGLGVGKLQVFYAIRIFLGLVSAAVETRFLAIVAKVVNARCAWFAFLMLAFNAGMWSASVALLPSSFTMYTTTLALSYALQPSRSAGGAFPTSRKVPFSERRRLLKAVASFALGAIVGWPFALVLSFPFVIEEVLLPSGNLVRRAQLLNGTLFLERLREFVLAAVAASAIAVPVFIVDSLFYGKPALIPLNIITYNILSGKRGAGPELYGVESPWFYLANLALNAGPILLLLALGSLPALFVARILQPERFTSGSHGDSAQSNPPAATKGHNAGTPSSLTGSSSMQLLALRLAPFYLWLGLLSTQPHKEERFMFPAYTAMCFNAALALELAVGLLEGALRLWRERSKANANANATATAKPVAAGSTPRKPAPTAIPRVHLLLPNLIAVLLLFVSALFALLRVGAIVASYHAPLSILAPLSASPDTFRGPFLREGARAGARTSLPSFHSANASAHGPDSDGDGDGDDTLRVCYGKEWYRFPTSLFLPAGFSPYFIKSEFSGILPKHFLQPEHGDDPREALPLPPTPSLELSGGEGAGSALVSLLDGALLPSGVPALLRTTRTHQRGFNDLNLEEWDRYVDAGASCHFLVDSDLPLPSSQSPGASPPRYEPRYVADAAHWEVLACLPFLDSEASKGASARAGGGALDRVRRTLGRVLWIPPRGGDGSGLVYREYCLLANKGLMRASGEEGVTE